MNLTIITSSIKEYVKGIVKQHTEITISRIIIWNALDGASQLEGIKNEQSEAILIAVPENRFLATILEYLHDISFDDKIYVVRLFALDKKLDFLDGIEQNFADSSIIFDDKLIDRISLHDGKPYLVHLETHVCDHCNLNCKACNNFAPYVGGHIYANPVKFERDVRKLSELFSGIGRFFLLGGEPLLAPQLCCDMIRIYRKCFPKNELRVLTNATKIMEMEDWFWDCLRDNDVIIQISLYPPVKENINVIENRLNEKGISYIIFKRVERFAKRLTEYPFEDPITNNLRCGSGGCHYLRDGIITKCPDAWLSRYLPGEYGRKFRSRDNINLYESDGWEIIKKTNAPIDLCRYCACTHVEWIEWESSGADPKVQDWLARNRYQYENDMLKNGLDDVRKNLIASEEKNEKAVREIRILLEKFNLLIKENERLESENEGILKNLSKIRIQLESEKRINEDIRAKQCLIGNELNEMNKRMADISCRLDDKEKQYSYVMTSYSYRIGLIFTSLPRAVRRFWRSARRNGVCNAVRGSFK